MNKKQQYQLESAKNLYAKRYARLVAVRQADHLSTAGHDASIWLTRDVTALYNKIGKLSLV